MSEFVLFTDVKTKLGRICLILVENTSKSRFHFRGAVHLQNAVIQKSGEALWKLVKWGMNALQFLHFKIWIHVDIGLEHVMWLLISGWNNNLNYILLLLNSESQPSNLIRALTSIKRLTLNFHWFGGDFSRVD